MNLSKYNNIIIISQEETEKMLIHEYRELIENADLLLAYQGSNKYRVMKDSRHNNMKNEMIHLEVNDVAKALLK